MCNILVSIAALFAYLHFKFRTCFSFTQSHCCCCCHRCCSSVYKRAFALAHCVSFIFLVFVFVFVFVRFVFVFIYFSWFRSANNFVVLCLGSFCYCFVIVIVFVFGIWFQIHFHLLRRRREGAECCHQLWAFMINTIIIIVFSVVRQRKGTTKPGR